MDSRSKLVPANDWRRSGQENYLKGVVLQLETYAPPRPSWDHEHCEFCNSKISQHAEDLPRGYATPDRYRWICETCFEDFREEFGFVVQAAKH